MSNSILFVDSDNNEIIAIFEETNKEFYNHIEGAVTDFLKEDLEEELEHETEWGTFPSFCWPTEYSGRVTQAFGINESYYSKWSLPGHEGIDMVAPHGSDIFCVWDGVVKLVGWHNAYGNHVRVRHEIDGIEYESVYAHFAEPCKLEEGDVVTRGSKLGLADSTGNSTGSHLHFSLKQFSGSKPETHEQGDTKQFGEWPYDIIDPTPFFKELN